MSRGFFGSFLVIAAAAGLGYWLCSDSDLQPRPALKLKETIGTPPFVAAANAEEPERFVAQKSGELIDLSTVYEPTEQLDLQFFLDSIVYEPELLGAPPRMVEVELLPQPRLVANNTFPDAGEEASSPPSQFDLLRQRIGMILVEKFVEILGEMQPLKGGVPAPVEDDDEM